MLSQTLTMEREEKEREERERAAAADAAAEASAAAMVAVEAAAGAIAASFRAARDNQRLNSPSAYSALASAYYDQRSSLSAADAARSRLSSGEASSTPAPPAGGEARVSTAAAMAVPSPLDIARGAGAPPPASCRLLATLTARLRIWSDGSTLSLEDTNTSYKGLTFLLHFPAV